MLISIGTLLLLLRFGVPGLFNTVHTQNSIHLHPLSNTNNILAAWHPFVSQHLPIPLSINRITMLSRRGLKSRLHRTRFRSVFKRILLRAISGLQSIGSQDRLRRMRVIALPLPTLVTLGWYDIGRISRPVAGEGGRSSPKWVTSTSLAWMSLKLEAMCLKLTLPPSITKDSRIYHGKICKKVHRMCLQRLPSRCSESVTKSAV